QGVEAVVGPPGAVWEWAGADQVPLEVEADVADERRVPEGEVAPELGGEEEARVPDRERLVREDRVAAAVEPARLEAAGEVDALREALRRRVRHRAAARSGRLRLELAHARLALLDALEQDRVVGRRGAGREAGGEGERGEPSGAHRPPPRRGRRRARGRRARRRPARGGPRARPAGSAGATRAP